MRQVLVVAAVSLVGCGGLAAESTSQGLEIPAQVAISIEAAHAPSTIDATAEVHIVVAVGGHEAFATAPHIADGEHDYLGDSTAGGVVSGDHDREVLAVMFRNIPGDEVDFERLFDCRMMLSDVIDGAGECRVGDGWIRLTAQDLEEGR